MGLFVAHREGMLALNFLARQAGGRVHKLKAIKVMRDIIAEREAFNRVKREIASTIEEMRKANPEAAKYLEAHLVIDEQAMTFKYTGDGRLQMTRMP